MSFLLDALRKNEDRKHLREVPTIFSPGPAGAGSRGRRRYGPVVLLLLPAFLVLLWFGSRQYVDPAEQAGDTAVRTTAGIPAPRENGAADLATAARREPEAAAPARQAEPGQPETVPRVSVSDTRTPVESLPVPPEAEPGSGEALAPGAGEPAAPETGAVAATDSTDPEPAGSLAAQPDPTPEPEPFQPNEPAVITYWQLPGAIRGELPALRISVLVYAERPEDRFLLVNGRRLVEGDALSPGLVAEEIRRDGVVFSYRLYRFLVTR
jgi:general secretion pathway protein B